MEGVESQRQAFPSSPSSLEISHSTRDSHIPPALAKGNGKVENQKQVSHFPIPLRDNDLCSLSPEPNGLRPTKPPLRGAPGTVAESGQQLHAEQKGAFPRPPTPQVFRIILYWKRKSISGSSFDWNMLRPPNSGDPKLRVYQRVDPYLAGPDQTMFERITFNPTMMGGRACIRGMRITVAFVVFTRPAALGAF